MGSVLFRNITYKVFAYKSFYMRKKDLALNNPQGLVCHNTE